MPTLTAAFKQRNYSAPLIALACALAILFSTLFLAILPFNRGIVARRDYIVYWATGQLLAHHGNPYDAAAIAGIEKSAGFEGGASYYMRNVPWALPLALPLGYVGAQAAALPWSLAMLALLLLSVRILLRALGRPAGYVAWLAYCFPPALFCILLGQTSILLLLGLVLFLRWHRERPLAAGAALWLCLLKPHLFLPFGLVVLAWIVVERQGRILAGTLGASAVAAAITELLTPGVWHQYLVYMRTSVITREFTPCFGDLLRDRIDPRAEILAFVPAMLGCAWALGYFWPRRHRWDWFEHGGLVMLVSLLVAPFGWVFDQALALPALVWAVARTRSQPALAALAILYLAIEVQLNRAELHSAWYLWTAPAWIVWYVVAMRGAKQPSEDDIAGSPS